MWDPRLCPPPLQILSDWHFIPVAHLVTLAITWNNRYTYCTHIWPLLLFVCNPMTVWFKSALCRLLGINKKVSQVFHLLVYEADYLIFRALFRFYPQHVLFLCFCFWNKGRGRWWSHHFHSHIVIQSQVPPWCLSAELQLPLCRHYLQSISERRSRGEPREHPGRPCPAGDEDSWLPVAGDRPPFSQGSLTRRCPWWQRDGTRCAVRSG